MLYLIKTSFYNKETTKFSHALKIGYTNDIKSRMSQYHSDNPYIELLSTRDGDQFIESLFHNYFKEYKLSIPGRPMNREWLEYSEEIIETFDKLLEKELILLSISDSKERSFVEIIYNHFSNSCPELYKLFGDKNYRSIVEEYLTSLIYYTSDIDFLFNQLQDLLKVELDVFIKKSFIDSFTKIFDVLSDIPDIFINNNDEISQDLENQRTLAVSRLNEVRDVYKSQGCFEHKIKSICDILLDTSWCGNIYISDLYWLPLKYKNYLIYFGPKRIKALGYHESNLRKELDILKSEDALRDTIISQFNLGNKYTLKEAKEILRNIYINLNLTKTPKATDLKEYFNVEYVFTYEWFGDNRKRVKGYKILSIK